MIMMRRWPVRMKPRLRQLLSARVTVARDVPAMLASSSCDNGNEIGQDALLITSEQIPESVVRCHSLHARVTVGVPDMEGGPITAGTGSNDQPSGGG